MLFKFFVSLLVLLFLLLFDNVCCFVEAFFVESPLFLVYRIAVVAVSYRCCIAVVVLCRCCLIASLRFSLWVVCWYIGFDCWSKLNHSLTGLDKSWLVREKRNQVLSIILPKGLIDDVA